MGSEQPRATDDKPRILIIEDEEFLCKLLARKLEQSGFVVKSAFDGESGLEVVAADAPDLILLDLLLPGIDGFEVIRRLKSDPKANMIPIVIISNLGEPGDIASATKLGAAEYLVKAEYTPDQIVKKVWRHLAPGS